MRIDIVYPNLPPVIDGIGDHTALLAGALVRAGHRVRLLTRAAPGGLPLGDGIDVVQVWPAGARPSSLPLVRRLRDDPPDAVVLQFEQFAYGTRGFNPGFSLVFLLLRLLRVPTVRVLYAHEAYVTPDRLRWIPMWIVQASQFRVLVRAADVVCVAAELWLAPVRRAGGSGDVVPIFSNIPRLDPMGEVADLQAADVVAVWFGYLDESRAPYFDAFVDVMAEDPRSLVVYVGKDHGRAADRVAGSGVRFRVEADASAEKVSSWLRAADLAVAPFVGGVSARRGSFLAALAHGARAVTTVGPSTDSRLRAAWTDGLFGAGEGIAGFVAALRLELSAVRPRRSRQDEVEPDAQSFYMAHFSPDAAATRIVELIAASGPSFR